MSFILDQLKKSGKQRALEMAMRRQKEKPGELTVEPLLARSADRMPVSMRKWQFAVVAVLFGTLAVYGVVAFLRGPSPMRRPVVPAPKGPVQEAAPLPVMPSYVPLVQIPHAHVQEEITSNAKSPAVEQKQTGAAKDVKHETAPERGRNVPEQAGSDRSAEERGKRLPVELTDAPIGGESSSSVWPTVGGSVLEFKQLPQAVRKSLPEIRITSHLYRKDSALVSINGRIMSEGFNMDDGLYLEKITSEGVILSYGKHRFLVRAER